MLARRGGGNEENDVRPRYARVSEEDGETMRVAILGGGCAGSSLAYYLARGGFTGEIDIFDRRTTFEAEQRWCSWGPVPDDFASLISYSWPRWSVASSDTTVTRVLPRRPYVHIYAPDFYRYIFACLAAYPRVRLHTGVAVSHVKETSHGIRLETSDGSAVVDRVFDSRVPPAHDRSATALSGAIHQSFVGQVVRTDRPVFDPSTATLMDFRVQSPEHDGLPFMYVLPFAPTCALVESTAFATRTLSSDEHRARVAAYLSNRGTGRYTVEREERGDVIMTAARYPLRPSPRHTMIGTAAGGLRPSSGYGFVRIQRHAQAVATTVLRGAPPPPRLARPMGHLLDAVFLDAIAGSRELARDSFVRLFGQVPPSNLVRFMSDEGTLFDALALVRALPKRPYLAAAARRLVPTANAHALAPWAREDI